MSTNSSAPTTLAPTNPLSVSVDRGVDRPEVSPLRGVVDVSKSEGPGPGFFVAYSLFALFLIVVVRRLWYGRWRGETAANGAIDSNNDLRIREENTQRLLEEQSAEQRAILLSYFEAAQTELVGFI